MEEDVTQQIEETEQPEESEQVILDSDLAVRTAMLFGLEVSREHACSILGVPWLQSDAWEDLWDELEADAKEQSLEG